MTGDSPLNQLLRLLNTKSNPDNLDLLLDIAQLSPQELRFIADLTKLSPSELEKLRGLNPTQIDLLLKVSSMSGHDLGLVTQVASAFLAPSSAVGVAAAEERYGRNGANRRGNGNSDNDRSRRGRRRGGGSRRNGCYPVKFKTSLCRHYEKGQCPFGKECAFAHGIEELQPLPQTMMNSRSSTPDSEQNSNYSGNHTQQPLYNKNQSLQQQYQSIVQLQQRRGYAAQPRDDDCTAVMLRNLMQSLCPESE